MPTLVSVRHLYPGYDPVHGFDHIERVYHLALKIASVEGADEEIVGAAALLHDAVGSNPQLKARSSHHEASAELAERLLREEGWDPERIARVQTCIRGHRYRNGGIPPETLEARVLFDADKLDVLGAIGAARTIAYAVQASVPHYCEPSDHFITTGQTTPGEAHSAYHEYIFKLKNVRQRLFTPTARAIAEARHAAMVAFFEQLRAECRGER